MFMMTLATHVLGVPEVVKSGSPQLVVTSSLYVVYSQSFCVDPKKKVLLTNGRHYGAFMRYIIFCIFFNLAHTFNTALCTI